MILCRKTTCSSHSRTATFKFRTEPNVFILNQGKRWYVAATSGCRMQQFDAEPPEPGELIGRFEIRDDALVFSSLEKPAADAARAR